MGSLKKMLLLILAMLSVTVTCVTFFHLSHFLSDFPSPANSNLTAQNLKLLTLQDESLVSYATEATVVDISLLCIFIIQHSSLLPLQDILSEAIGLPVLSRSLLNTFTSASLQLLMHFWKPIPQYVVWAFDTKEQSRQLVFAVVHALSWLLIYIMMITVDITDLLGIKQVYYYTTGRPEPSTLKSHALRKIHHKMRHPSFLGFLVIFWVYPCMRLDRLLLAVVWSLYMVLVWRPDSLDYNYVVQQQVAKRSVL